MPDKYWKPTVSSAGQVSWSLTDSTTAPESQNIKGPSPVKGTDYFTAAEKAEMVSDLASTIQSSKLESKNITQNGSYTPSSGKVGFSSVNVNVSGGAPVIQSKTITENGTYTAPSGVDGFSPVVVNVPSGPTVQTYDGNVTISTETTGPVYKTMEGLTFTPDIILVYGMIDQTTNTQFYGVIPLFAHTGQASIASVVYNVRTSPSSVYDYYGYRVSNGNQQLSLLLFSSSGYPVSRSNVTVNYKAVKWTS